MYGQHTFFRQDVGVCGNVCCVAVVVKDSVFRLGVLKYVVWYVYVSGVMDVVFNFYIVTRGAVGAHLWEV